MNFRSHKLPKNAAMELKRCPIDSLSPYVLVASPIYLFMRKNEKFLVIKSPLDFFTEAELQKLKPFHSFYVPKFIDSVIPFIEAAKSVRILLTWEPQLKHNESQSKKYPEVALPIAPFELSDAIVRAIAPLFGQQAVIEPFFVFTFINELCDPLPGDLLTEARSKDPTGFEKAILQSTWATFLCLALGYGDLPWLNQYWQKAFQYFTKSSDVKLQISETPDQILTIIDEQYQEEIPKLYQPEFFAERQDRASQKVHSRFKRLSETLVKEGQQTPTIYGEGGVCEF